MRDLFWWDHMSASPSPSPPTITLHARLTLPKTKLAAFSLIPSPTKCISLLQKYSSTQGMTMKFDHCERVTLFSCEKDWPQKCQLVCGVTRFLWGLNFLNIPSCRTSTKYSFKFFLSICQHCWGEHSSSDKQYTAFRVKTHTWQPIIMMWKKINHSQTTWLCELILTTIGYNFWSWSLKEKFEVLCCLESCKMCKLCT